MSELISVVVPVYNVEKYLQRCLESVLAQTYKDIEIILVDDGSTDNSGQICDQYANKDNRIIVIHKPNGGLSDARNAGIEILHGKYVTFIDSDDWIEPSFVEYLHSLITNSNADMSVCDFNYIDAENKLYNSPSKDGREYVWSRKEAVEMLLVGKKMETSAWGKMYASRYFTIDGFRYPVGRLFEDIPVTYGILLKAKVIVYGNKALYNYFYRPQSISNMKFSPRRLHAVEHLEQVIPLVLNQFPEFYSRCKIAIFRMNFGIYLSLMEGDNDIYAKKIVNGIKQNRLIVIFSRHSTMKWRIKALITLFGSKITRRLFSR